MKNRCSIKHPFKHWVGLFRVCQAAFISIRTYGLCIDSVKKNHEIDNLRNWFDKNPFFSWHSEQCLVACDGIVIVIEIDDVFPIVLRTSKRRSESARLIDPINPGVFHEFVFLIFFDHVRTLNIRKMRIVQLFLSKTNKTRISFHCSHSTFFSYETSGIVNDRSGDITIVERHTP